MSCSRCIMALMAVFLWCHSSYGGMYRCVESNGSVRYTDTFESEACEPMVFRDHRTAFGPGNMFIGEAVVNKRAAKYQQMIDYYGVRYNIDPHLIRAVIRTESAFDPRAISKKGAKGLMQLMPDTAKDLSVNDPFDPEENIEGGTRYLRELLNTFKQDLNLALAAYNAGPTLVKKTRKIPRIPETQKYVKRVLKFYKIYKKERA